MKNLFYIKITFIKHSVLVKKIKSANVWQGMLRQVTGMAVEEQDCSVL